MIRENLVKAVGALLLFTVLLGVLGYFLEDELVRATNWVVTQIGFPGLCLLLLLTDGLVTPFPPDAILLVIAKSRLAEHWLGYVLVLGSISAAAGCLGWCIGRWLGHIPWVAARLAPFKALHGDFIRKYGFWAIVIGAITPLPYSLTCWGAGVVGLRFMTVFTASALFRVPRFILFYWVIVNMGHLGT